MSEEIAVLRAEVEALRAELTGRQDQRIARRRLLSGLVGAGAATAVGVAGARPAAAAAGDDVVLGADNVSAVTTQLRSGGTEELPEEPAPSAPVLYVENGTDGGSAITAVGVARGLIAAGGLEGISVSGDSVGVQAESAGLVAVDGRGLDSAVGVAARSVDGAALWLESEHGVHLKVVPTTVVGPPAPNAEWPAEPGEVVVDSATDIWLCTAEGPPAVWTRLLREDTATGRTVPIAPLRVLDTRVTGGRPSGAPAVPGQKKGPLKGGQPITLDLAGVATIPATAHGVVGNVTVVGPSFGGWVAVRPSGASVTTSTVNFSSGRIVANAFTSALGSNGLSAVASGSSADTYHLVLDITAYIT